jgi:hypothetical protein
LWPLFKEAKAVSKRAFWCVAELFIELGLQLKTNLDSHAAKHQESKLKNLLKRKKFLGNFKSSTYVCAFVLEKLPAKGTCCGQD